MTERRPGSRCAHITPYQAQCGNGVVEDGESEIDESMVTGEPLAVREVRLAEGTIPCEA